MERMERGRPEAGLVLAGGGRSGVWDTHHPGNEMSLALGAGGTIPGPAEAGQEARSGLWFQENANQFQMVMEHPAPPQPGARCTRRSCLLPGAGSSPKASLGNPRQKLLAASVPLTSLTPCFLGSPLESIHCFRAAARGDIERGAAREAFPRCRHGVSESGF